MLTKRIIACLDVTNGRVVKGVQFLDLRDAGDPAELAHRHAAAGADEIVLSHSPWVGGCARWPMPLCSSRRAPTRSP